MRTRLAPPIEPDRPSVDMPIANPSADPSAPPPTRRWLHLLLFGLTIATTLFVGLGMSEGFSLNDDGVFEGTPLRAFLGGVGYSVSIVGILFAHEMGHYLTARRFGVNATPPFFIPIPLMFGTLGAFIRMRVTKRVPGDHFMRVAAYGPIAGFVVTIPVLVVGLMLSKVGAEPESAEAALTLGDSALMWLLHRGIVGELPPGQELWLHPVAFAGWGGLLITAFNLLPVSQLDGGHISYCLFGERHNRVVGFVFGALVLTVIFVYSGWLLLCILVWMFGVRHPPLCDGLPVSGKSRTIGVVCIVIFALSFMPTPIGGVGPLLDAIWP